jgi:2'-5' RNA ligase
MRLFVAVQLPDDAREEVLRVRAELITPLTRQGVRFVKPEKLHLTLSFLGNVPPESLPALCNALAKIPFAPIPLRLARLGCFPNCGRPKVIWIGIDGETEPLRVLSEAVTEIAKPFAPQLDDKPFSAHITLARISPGSKEIGRLLATSQVLVSPTPLVVDAISLYHSLADGTYEVLRRYPAQ